MHGRAASESYFQFNCILNLPSSELTATIRGSPSAGEAGAGGICIGLLATRSGAPRLPRRMDLCDLAEAPEQTRHRQRGTTRRCSATSPGLTHVHTDLMLRVLVTAKDCFTVG